MIEESPVYDVGESDAVICHRIEVQLSRVRRQVSAAVEALAVVPTGRRLEVILRMESALTEMETALQTLRLHHRVLAQRYQGRRDDAQAYHGA